MYFSLGALRTSPTRTPNNSEVAGGGCGAERGDRGGPPPQPPVPGPTLAALGKEGAREKENDDITNCKR